MSDEGRVKINEIIIADNITMHLVGNVYIKFKKNQNNEDKIINLKTRYALVSKCSHEKITTFQSSQ